MTYDDLVRNASRFPVFDESHLGAWGWVSKSARQLQLGRWTRAGKLLRLKRGLYALPEDRRRTSLSLEWLANRLYSPSYLSLEFMLSWYGLVPERVSAPTSVSPLKTATFRNPLGTFVYRNVKRELFFGFQEVKDEFGKFVVVATAEKALLDTIYLGVRGVLEPETFEEGMRLQQLGELRKTRLKEYARRFGSRRISKGAEILLGMMG